MNLSKEQIKEMAQDLEAGMKLFINKETLEYRSVLDWDDMIDPEPWDEDIKKIESEWSDYIVIEKMESHESYNVMVDFVDEVNDIRLKEDLIKILNRRSPFANFKAEIESSDYREEWFAFRTKKYEEYIKEYLDIENMTLE